MNRILLDMENGPIPDQVVLRDRQAAHVRDVLKCRPGDRVRIGWIDGPRGAAIVTGMDAQEITLRVEAKAPPLPSTGITVLMGLPRPKVLKRLWPAVAMLGIERLILTNAAKVERAYFDTHWLDPVHYRPLLIEGLEQSGDTRLPSIVIRRRFKPMIEDESDALLGSGRRLVCHPSDAPPMADRLPHGGTPVALAIGPEGGWTGYEIGLMKTHGFTPVSVGPRILRSDIALTALAGVVLAFRRDEDQQRDQSPPVSTILMP